MIVMRFLNKVSMFFFSISSVCFVVSDGVKPVKPSACEGHLPIDIFPVDCGFSD